MPRLGCRRGPRSISGCGTGDSSIYLARHGWQVTGVDFVSTALDKARAKADAERLPVNFMQADAALLSSAGVGTGFALILDNGCLHGMIDDHRDAYVREITAVAAPRRTVVDRRVHSRWVVRRTDRPGRDRGTIYASMGSAFRRR